MIRLPGPVIFCFASCENEKNGVMANGLVLVGLYGAEEAGELRWRSGRMLLI